MHLPQALPRQTPLEHPPRRYQCPLHQANTILLTPPRLKAAREQVGDEIERRLTTETVKGTALALEGVDDIERGDGLALGVLGIGDSVTDDGLKEGLEDATGLFVDHYKVERSAD